MRRDANAGATPPAPAPDVLNRSSEAKGSIQDTTVGHTTTTTRAAADGCHTPQGGWVGLCDAKVLTFSQNGNNLLSQHCFVACSLGPEGTNEHATMSVRRFRRRAATRVRPLRPKPAPCRGRLMAVCPVAPRHSASANAGGEPQARANLPLQICLECSQRTISNLCTVSQERQYYHKRNDAPAKPYLGGPYMFRASTVVLSWCGDERRPSRVRKRNAGKTVLWLP